MNDYTNNIFNSNKFGYTDEDINDLIITNEVCSSLSLVGSILVILMFWFFKESRNINLEIVFWLCISNVFYFITAFFPYNPNKEENDTWCKIQAFMIIMFQNSSYIWSALIGYCSFITVIKKEHLERNSNKYRVAFLLISFLFSGLIASM